MSIGALDGAEWPRRLLEPITPRSARAGWARCAVLGLAVVIAYVGSAKLGLALSVEHGVITPVWAPTGIALAALVLWSDELYRLYGLEPQSVDLTYESFLAGVHQDDRERVASAVTRALEERAPFALEYRAVLPDGTSRWLHSRGRPATGAGDSQRMLGTCQDVTERRRVDELRDSILSTISHELRTPLTSIVGFSVTLEERAAELPEDVRVEIHSHLSAESRRLDSLLSALLDADRLRHGPLQPTFRRVDVGRVVADVVARTVSGPASDGRSIHVEAASADAEVDPPKVERIVENLLANAIKYAPAGTPIGVRVEALDGNVLIAVDDRGSGVEADKRESIFELFDRGDADPRVGGTGIGLALVARFSDLHGSRAWVEPNPGGGSSFRVLLPAVRPREVDGDRPLEEG